MLYYGTKLSQNISKREPEGYLVCLNVPVARTGAQEYLPEEVGRPPGHGELVTVFRPEEEVFSPECIASFEGMPVTDDHPEDPEGVTVETCSILQKGHAQNLRRGSGSESDLLIADLLITDPELINHILSGKREISCGYNYDLCQEDGKFIQRKIRGNHIAVVDAGRAGHRVSIKDHKAQRSCFAMQKKKNLLSRLIASYAKDEDTTAEEVAAVVEALLTEEAGAQPVHAEADPAAVIAVVPEETAADPVVVAVPQEAAEQENPATDADDPAGILERLDRVISLLEQLVTPAVSADAEETVPLEEIVEALVEAGPEDTAEEVLTEIIGEAADPEGELLPDECSDPAEEEGDCGTRSQTTADAMRSVLQAMKPVIASMPKAQRKQVVDRLSKQMRSMYGQKSAGGSRTYAALKNARRASADAEDPRALGKRIMAARNANCTR